MDFSAIVDFCRAFVNACFSLVEPLVSVFSMRFADVLEYVVDVPYVSNVLEHLIDSPIADAPLLTVLFGTGFIAYICYQIVKWFLDIVL